MYFARTMMNNLDIEKTTTRKILMCFFLLQSETENKNRRLQLLMRYLPKEGNSSFFSFIEMLEDLNKMEVAIILKTDAANLKRGEI